MPDTVSGENAILGGIERIIPFSVFISAGVFDVHAQFLFTFLRQLVNAVCDTVDEDMLTTAITVFQEKYSFPKTT